MSIVTHITLNGVTTTSPILIDCDLVRLLSEDCDVKEHIHLEHPSFSANVVEKFFTFGCVWNKPTTDLDMSTLLVEFLRIANYLGCSENVHVMLAKQLTAVYGLMTFSDVKWSRILLNCARFYIESTPYIRKTLPPFIMNMSREICDKLLESGDATHEELMKYSPNHRMFPLEIPQPHKDAFYVELNKHKKIVDCVNKVKGCYIVGGYLVNCMKSYIMDGRNSIDDDLTVSDIDVFCLSQENLIELLDLLYESAECRVFIRNSVITVFFRHSPVQVQLVWMRDECIDDVMKEVDLPCSALAYRNGVLLTPKSFHKVVDNDWCVDLDPCMLYDTSRLAKYSNRGFVMKDHEFEAPKISRNKWYTWTDETDDELLVLVKMVYGNEYEVFDDVGKLVRGSIDRYTGKLHEHIDHTSHKFELMIASNSDAVVELQSRRQCAVPTYVLKDTVSVIRTIDNIHYVTLNDETKKNLDVIGHSMLKQVPGCDAYIKPKYVYANWWKLPEEYNSPTLWVTASQAATVDGRTVLVMDAYIV